MLPYGALVLERLLKAHATAARSIFSVFGIREGLIYSLLPRARAPQGSAAVSFCAEYAGLRSRSVEHAWELCKWTDELFEPPGPRGDAGGAPPAPRRLPDLRHRLARASRLSRRAEPQPAGPRRALGGIDHPGRVFLALAIFYRHTGASQEHADRAVRAAEGLVTKRAQKRARIVGAAIRAAHMLSIGVAGVIDETPLSYDGDKLVLSIPKAYAGLDGERLRRRFERWPSLVGRSCRKSASAGEQTHCAAACRRHISC